MNASADINTKDPELRDLISQKYRKEMIQLFHSTMWKWPSISVGESMVDFAERKRVLVAGTSARPGPYRFSVTPYLREIGEEQSENSLTTESVIMKGTQTGGTDGIMMNHELYAINYGLGPVQYVSSDDDLALEHMEKRIDPMITAAKMGDKIIPPTKKKGSRITGDTKRSKSYAGTFLRATGARSESKLSSLPSRILHIDEIDKYPLKLSGGGDSVEKAVRRTDSYGNLKKIIYISTPKLKSESRIGPLFRQGDMRQYNIPCPKCGKLQPMVWGNFSWAKDDDGRILIEYNEDNQPINDPVYYECNNPDCKYHMKYHEKAHFLKEEGHGGRAKWIPTKRPDRPGIKSWHIPAWLGFRSWLDIALQWDRIQGDKEALQEFINDVAGEEYEEDIDKPDSHFLMSRVETDWDRGQVPEFADILTMGIDVHPNRLECQLMGYGNFKEAASCEYFVIEGEIYTETDPAWDVLEVILKSTYETMDGRSLSITTAFLDSGGIASSVVHAFCARFPYSAKSWVGVFPTIGKATLRKITAEYPSNIPAPDIHIDEQRVKKEIYTNLKKHPPAVGNRFPGGYIHFHDGYNEDYFKQLTAEEIITHENNKGQVTLTIGNTKGRRNESLDTMKLALAALYYIQGKYFDLWNAALKRRKKKEVLPSWATFWAQFGREIVETVEE